MPNTRHRRYLFRYEKRLLLNIPCNFEMITVILPVGVQGPAGENLVALTVNHSGIMQVSRPR